MKRMSAADDLTMNIFFFFLPHGLFAKLTRLKSIDGLGYGSNGPFIGSPGVSL